MLLNNLNKNNIILSKKNKNFKINMKFKYKNMK